MKTRFKFLVNSIAKNRLLDLALIKKISKNNVVTLNNVWGWPWALKGLDKEFADSKWTVCYILAMPGSGSTMYCSNWYGSVALCSILYRMSDKSLSGLAERVLPYYSCDSCYSCYLCYSSYSYSSCLSCIFVTPVTPVTLQLGLELPFTLPRHVSRNHSRLC